MATLPRAGEGEHNGYPVGPTRPSPVPHGPPRGVLGTEASGSLDSSGYPAPDRTFYWFQQLCGWDRGDQRTEQGSTALTWQQGGPGGHGSFGRHLDLCVPAALGPVAGWGAASGAGVTVLTVPVGSQLAQGRLARRMWGGLGILSAPWGSCGDRGHWPRVAGDRDSSSAPRVGLGWTVLAICLEGTRQVPLRAWAVPCNPRAQRKGTQHFKGCFRTRMEPRAPVLSSPSQRFLNFDLETGSG